MSRFLRSWGRYPDVPQQAHPCHWRDDLSSQLQQLVGTHGSTLAYGNGRSYGDSCLAGTDQVLHLRSLNRFIHLDWQQGIVRAEAGVTLGEILALAIPRGWFLAVTPGTQFATLGGALANDVHGKNHHRRGSFGHHVRCFGLLRHGEELRHCSASEHPQLFAATIGGLGLTGVIGWVEIQLMPVRTGQIDTLTQRFANLTEFFTLSAELDARHEYSVAWVDCLARGRQRGRGVLFLGDHADYGPPAAPPARKLSVPLTPPLSLVNPATLLAFNTLYWHRHPAQLTRGRSAHDPFFFPLDRILHWNRIYGRRGFQQYQCVIPEAVAEDAIGELLDCIAASGQGSFLAVLKRCGNLPSPGLLSFPLPGCSLALDFPQTPQLQNLFTRLDAIVHQAGGRLYPAKDAHMRGADFRQAYPRWEQLEALRDPALTSRFWKRVTA